MSSVFQRAKIFVGGLSEATSLESFTSYFSVFGPIKDIFLSRGFGFVEYANETAIRQVLARNKHLLDGKQIDPKPALNRQMNRLREKLFVGGIPIDFTNKDMHDFFSKYGPLSDAFVIRDTRSGKSRGYGFIAYINQDDALKVLSEQFVLIGDHMVEICPEMKMPKGNAPYVDAANGMPFSFGSSSYALSDNLAINYVPYTYNYSFLPSTAPFMGTHSNMKRPLPAEYRLAYCPDDACVAPNTYPPSVCMNNGSTVNSVNPSGFQPQKRLKPKLRKQTYHHPETLNQ